MSSVSTQDNTLPIGSSDVKVTFPCGRDPRLPCIYIMKNHPLHSGDGTAYYFVHSGTREASEKTYRMEVEDLKIPQGPREDALALGGFVMIDFNTRLVQALTLGQDFTNFCLGMRYLVGCPLHLPLV